MSLSRPTDTSRLFDSPLQTARHTRLNGFRRAGKGHVAPEAFRTDGPQSCQPGSPAGEGILDPGEMMTMAMIDRSRAVKAASAAAVAAPYVRRLMRDDRLRDELRTLISSANHLYSELSSGDTVDTLLKDASIRKDVDRMIASLQHAGQRAVKDRSSGPNWFADRKSVV
jgi:hypothetical protein